MQKIDPKKLQRVLDANFNRSKEALRVCEDICRFIRDDRSATKSLKEMRHCLSAVAVKLGMKDFIKARDIAGDCGKATIASESQRDSIDDVYFANCQRVKESLRVLEEMAKLLNTRLAVELKNLRYQFYAFEKKTIK